MTVFWIPELPLLRHLSDGCVRAARNITHHTVEHKSTVCVFVLKEQIWKVLCIMVYYDNIGGVEPIHLMG